MDSPTKASATGLIQLNERTREIFRHIVESYLATGGHRKGTLLFLNATIPGKNIIKQYEGADLYSLKNRHGQKG